MTSPNRIKSKPFTGDTSDYHATPSRNGHYPPVDWRGLIVPDADWRHQAGPIFIVNEAGDVAELLGVGMTAIGRPSNVGIAQLAELLKDVSADRPIIVVGNNDQQPNGDWPGREGAKRTAGLLAEQLRRPVQWALVPDDAENCRQWIIKRLGDPTEAEELGQELSKRLQADAEGPTNSPDASAFKWTPINSAEFARTDYRPTWLVKGALVAGQPCIVGGPQKSLKTTIAVVDLGVSIATATPWLGKFDVPTRRRVAIASGESGPHTLQETARRVGTAKGIELESLGNWLQWQFQLPQLSATEQLKAMRAGLLRDKIETCIIDPLYLSLLAGNTDLAASNLYDIGPLLLRVAEACLSIGVTPILAHHTVKPSAKKYEPLDLTDLAFSGVAEFARQWVLLSRREPYEGGTGKHALWMVIGGSCGHGGHYAVDIDEGILGDDFTGRTWQVSVMPAGEARQAQVAIKADAKADARRQRDGDDERAVLQALDQLGGIGTPVPWGKCLALSHVSKERFARAIDRLIVAKTVGETTMTIGIGNRAKRDSKALIRLADEGDR